MSWESARDALLTEDGVELSTMMKSPCLRYKGDFIGMFFVKGDALIIKVSPQRVNALIEEGIGNEFNFTKKRFKEWVLIPTDLQDDYTSYLREALDYAKLKSKS